MSFNNLQETINALEAENQLLRIKEEVDPHLEMAEIHRRIYQKKGPAILFERVKSSPFCACSNIYGTNERCEFLFKDSIKGLEHLIKLKINPLIALKEFGKTLKYLPFIYSSLPKNKITANQVLHSKCKISDLPQIVSWPNDGGAFITLPQVISFPPHSQKLAEANIGMYRIQMSGNNYDLNKEIGLHYQLHRGIGIHHQLFNHSDEDFKVSIAIGGPPSHALGSIFPLPEGLSEILFTGLLGNKRYQYVWNEGYFIPSDTDFCITGIIQKNQLKPEGPFGDHLGYYSLKHDFPFIQVENVFHKKDPIWHFTVVGRPPQEDSGFGFLIHQMVKEIGKNEFPGVKEIHAVDVAGVHPLLLAIGSERYMPFRDKKPEEILTQANHILGKGQTSLAKYVFISTNEDQSGLNTHDIPNFLKYVLERVDWTKDLHFYTNTTIDTLDYSGQHWNEGSKLVIACHRDKQRSLTEDQSSLFLQYSFIAKARKIQAGIIAIQLTKKSNEEEYQSIIHDLCSELKKVNLDSTPLIVIVDDLDFVSDHYHNFLWVCFTRSNPSHDIYGVDQYIENKHWACKGSLIIDARIKPHHAPELLVDPEVSRKVDLFFQRNSELHQYL